MRKSVVLSLALAVLAGAAGCGYGGSAGPPSFNFPTANRWAARAGDLLPQYLLHAPAPYGWMVEYRVLETVTINHQTLRPGTLIGVVVYPGSRTRRGPVLVRNRHRALWTILSPSD